MKTLINFSFILILFSCKGEPLKENIAVKKELSSNKSENHFKHDEITDNCYDYLTELVRSSNFPFSEWKIDKNKINLLIDEDSDDIISCKLFFDTEGTGTIGWIQYHKNNGKLFNTSANLENPVELNYDLNWKKLFDSCSSSQKNKEISLKINPIEKYYNGSDELSLPNIYNYDEIVEEKGFKEIDKKHYNLFSIKHADNYKMARLPIINDRIKPIILITYNEIGQSTWYLFTLDNEYNPISNILLYTSEESDADKSKTTIYSITKNYEITITQLSNNKITNRKKFIISKEGFIQ